MKISGLYVSPGHNYFGRHGQPAGAHETRAVAEVDCRAGHGIRGDRFWDHAEDYAGQITFFAEEVHVGLLGELALPPWPPAAYRRNVLTRGADLTALIGQEFTVQGVRFRGMAECKPCYWMDRAVGAGAEAALRGRGGLRAKILSDGVLRVEDPLPAGLLLAGGRSTRLGRDKVQFDWRGRPLGVHQAETLVRAGAWPLYVACRHDQPWTPAAFTRVEDRGEGGALAAFVDAMGAIDSPVRLVLAVDVPLVTSGWLAGLGVRARDEGVSVVPQHSGRFEPFVAAWHPSALPLLRDTLADGRSLQVACAELERRKLLRVPPINSGEAAMLANLNTPADAARLGC